MWGQMQTVVFHRFAYTCCTASFQLFCGMSAIRYNVLSDRVFPQVCYRTLVKYKGGGFLGIFVVCGRKRKKKCDWFEKMYLYVTYSFEKVCRYECYSLEKV